MIIRLIHLLISGSFVIAGRHWIRPRQTGIRRFRKKKEKEKENEIEPGI
jgi:hypothetical protein